MTALRRFHRREEGATLVELLMVMIMMAVIGSIVASAVHTSFRMQRRQMAQVESLNELKLAFERVTRDARAADPILAGSTGTQLITRICRSGTYTTRTYRMQAGQLLGPGNAVLASNLTNSSTEPVFVYRNIDGNPLDIVSNTALIPDVRYVTVRLMRPAEAGASGGNIIDLRNRVTVRNSGGNTCF
jgi:type II secretory pathway pseudopilin PulG